LLNGTHWYYISFGAGNVFIGFEALNLWLFHLLQKCHYLYSKFQTLWRN